MTRLDGRAINSVRTIVAWIVRGAATVLLASGGYLLLKKALFAVGSLQLETFLDVYMEVGEGHDTYRGLAMLAIGVVLAVGSERIARWIIRVPFRGCPRCGHEQDTGRCTECGLDLGGGPAGRA